MLLMKYFACSLARFWRSVSSGQDLVIHPRDKSHSFKGCSGNVVEGEDRWFLKRSKRSHLPQNMMTILERGLGLRHHRSIEHSPPWTPIHPHLEALCSLLGHWGHHLVGTVQLTPPYFTSKNSLCCSGAKNKWVLDKWKVWIRNCDVLLSSLSVILTWWLLRHQIGTDPAISLTLTLHSYCLVLTWKWKVQKRQTGLKSLMWKGAVFEVKWFASPSSNHSSVSSRTILQSIQLNSLKCFLLWGQHSVKMQTW